MAAFIARRPAFVQGALPLASGGGAAEDAERHQHAAWRFASAQPGQASIDDAVAEAEDKGREAASAVREVSGHFVDAIDELIKTRPYTTLAIVAGIAFLFGATWRR